MTIKFSKIESTNTAQRIILNGILSDQPLEFRLGNRFTNFWSIQVNCPSFLINEVDLIDHRSIISLDQRNGEDIIYMNTHISLYNLKSISKPEIIKTILQSITSDFQTKFDCLNAVLEYNPKYQSIVINFSFKDYSQGSNHLRILNTIVEQLCDSSYLGEKFNVEQTYADKKEIVLFSSDFDAVALALQEDLFAQFGFIFEKKENGDYIAPINNKAMQNLPNIRHQMPNTFRAYSGKSKSDAGNGRYDIDIYDVFFLKGAYVEFNISRPQRYILITKKSCPHWM